MSELSWLVVKQAIRARFPEVRQLSTQVLADWLEQFDIQPPLLLDTRTPEEYAVSHLSNAIFLNYKQPDWSMVAEYPLDTPIVTYCSVGYRSSAIAHQLHQRGYTQTMNLEGSIFQWFNEGRPVYQQGQVVQCVHPYNAFWGGLLYGAKDRR